MGAIKLVLLVIVGVLVLATILELFFAPPTEWANMPMEKRGGRGGGKKRWERVVD